MNSSPESTARGTWSTRSCSGCCSTRSSAFLSWFPFRVADVDVDARKIFIDQGKGDKDRYILFPKSFRLALKAYLAIVPENQCLFESSHNRPYTPRRVQQVVQEYVAAAGVGEHVHPHLFRHQMLTWLTCHGVPDAAIQLISGHSSRKSLEVYQHLSLLHVEAGSQKAVWQLDI